MNVQRQLQSLLEIPNQLIKKYDKDQIYINSFVTANCLNDQIVAIKTIYVQANESPDVFQFLSDLYFTSPINHPVRNQIAKIFNKHDDILTDYISNSIDSLIIISEASSCTTCTYYNTNIVSLSGCFQNFYQGKKTLKLNLNKFVVFLCESLKKYLENLSHEYSPSLRNELYLYIHNSIRVFISCVQEFADVIKLSVSQIDFIKSTSKKLINSNETLMDTKTNLGILMAYIAKVCDTYCEYIISVSKLTTNNFKADSVNLCKCIGIINTFSIDDFKNHVTEICTITNIISTAALKYYNETNIDLAATRTLKYLSKTLLLLENIEKEYIEIILEILLDYSLLYVEHDMDSIRHMCKDMLRNIVQIFKKFQLNSMLDCYFKSSFHMDSITKKCIVLSSIASIIESNEILHKYPEIFDNLFKANITDIKVNNLFEILMEKSYKEIDFLTWKTIWIEFLLNIYCGENDTEVISCIENLFNKAIKCDVQVVNIILSSNVHLSTKFSVLWTVRKNGLIIKNFQIILKEFQNNFKLAFISDCDETKIMALRLLVETHKTTELITEVECHNILLFIIYNANLQNPSTRSKALRLLIKLLVRLDVNLERKLKKPNASEYLLNFLKEFLSLLTDNMFQGANFSRKSFCLNLLKHTIQILIKRNLDISIYLPQNFTNTTFKILEDPYCTNKSLATEILNLSKTDKNKTELIPYESLQILEKLLVSIRPSDSITAAYHLEHICNILELKEIVTLFNINSNIPSIYSAYYCALMWCMKILKIGISIANKSILLAAKINPLYGSICAIKHLVLKLDFKIISTDNLWNLFLTELIDVCKISCNIVSPIVNNCSPEGHLPNDFTEYFEEELKNEKKYEYIFNNKKYSENFKVTSQMILLCAWRTIKEVCTILGEIVLKATLESNQIFEIGEQLKQLLLETKHRGAFELAYVGFLKLCKVLWKLKDIDLNILPMKWLEDIINVIITDSKENNKICATRRGAGIPFMVQALIISELEIDTKRALDFCVPKLFEICNNQDIYNFVSRTHAFNILRALYRCKDLNNVINEYITDGVIFAIRGYNCTTWYEKNSATLLFSALVVRIFGVQETKDSDYLNIKNKMTGRIFFLRYSKLYDFFLEELKIANKSIEENKPVHNLQPILLILCRLYGSGLEGTDSNLKLDIFIPFLLKCSGSRAMYTRILVAKAVASIIPLDMIANHIMSVLTIYRFALLEDRLSTNYIHGLLLQVKYLLIYAQILSSEIIENILNELNATENIICVNAVILKTILDIKINILERIGEKEVHKYSHCLHKFNSTLILPESLSFYYPVFRQCLFIYNLHILRLNSHSSLLNSLLHSLKTDENISIEQTEAILSILVLITFKKSSQRNEIIDELEILENENNFINTLTFDSVQQLYVKLLSSKKIEKFLKGIIEDRKYYPKCIKKAYAILSQLDICTLNLAEILFESKLHHEDMKTTIALCVERIIMEHTYDKENNLYEVFEYLIDNSQPSVPFLLKLRLTRILAHLSKYFNWYIEKKFKKIIIAFACVIITLLNDDDSTIRTNISNIVLSINTVYNYRSATSIVPSYAQLIFIENIANILEKNFQQFNDKEFIKSIFVEIINFQLEQQKNSYGLNVEDDIFDKNEENIFAESTKVILDCKEVFFKYFDENI